MTQPTDQEFMEITEKYNSKGFLVERYYMDDGEKRHLPIPKFMQENPAVSYWDPKINWSKTVKRLSPKE